MVDSLDEPMHGADLARRVYLSQFHFSRLFKAAVRETPVAFRQRLLLERAGYQLQETRSAVTEIALDAGYSSLEAFTRAFRRAFKLAPSEFRGTARPEFRLPTRNGVHFHPPCGLLVAAATHKRRGAMDLIDRLLEHDLWLNRRLLTRAGELSDTQLDAPLALDHELLPFEAHQPTPAPTDRDSSLEGLRRRLDASGPEFVAIVREVRDRGQWDSAFVDALCDPPESFTFGGMAPMR